MARRKGGMTWLPLDVHFFEDDKVIDAGERPAVLFLAMCLKSKALGSDGVLTTRQVERLQLAGWKARLARLVEVGLVVAWGEDAWAMPAWFEHNDPAEKVQEIRAADAARKRNDRATGTHRPTGVRSDVHTESDRREEVGEKKEEKDVRTAGAGPCSHGADDPRLCALCRTAQQATP